MRLTNLEVKNLQERLQDIIQNIDANMEIIGNDIISDEFLLPIMNMAVKISDELFIQTKDTINNINIKL